MVRNKNVEWVVQNIENVGFGSKCSEICLEASLDCTEIALKMHWLSWNCSEWRWFLLIALKLLWIAVISFNCSETALELHWLCWSCSGITLNRSDSSQFFQNCPGTTLELLWICTKTALFLKAALKLHWFLRTAPNLQWFSWTALKLLWNCSETAPGVVSGCTSQQLTCNR